MDLYLLLKSAPWDKSTNVHFFCFQKSIYPGGETPCSCFQAKKVTGGKGEGQTLIPTVIHGPLFKTEVNDPSLGPDAICVTYSAEHRHNGRIYKHSAHDELIPIQVVFSTGRGPGMSMKYTSNVEVQPATATARKFPQKEF